FIVQPTAAHINAPVELARRRYRYHPRFAARLPVVNSARVVVINRDDGGIGSLLMREDLLLGGDVAFHTAMTVEMVGRDIQQPGDGAMQAWRQIELIRRKLEHIPAVSA